MSRQQRVGRVRYGLVLLLVLTGSSAARAELLFPRTAVDLGEVRGGPRLSYRFPFVNRGSEPATLLAAGASCGCLAPRFEKQVYNPGEGGSILLDINTLSEPPGRHTWKVDLRYRDGTAVRDVPLTLTARVVTEVQVRPGTLVMFAEQGVRHEVTLADARAKPLTITHVQTSSPHLAARLAGEGKDDQGLTIRRVSVEVSPDYPEGRHAALVTLHTDDLAYRELTVPVTVVKKVQARLVAHPNHVAVTAPAGQPVPSRLLLIKDQQGEPVVVARVVADDPAVTCTWAPGPNNHATVRVAVDRNRVHGAVLRSLVHVHLSKPVPEILTLPVTVSLP